MLRPYFPEKPIKLDYIYFHLGRFAMYWSEAEEAVDTCVDKFSRAVPDPYYRRPISTKRRITAFRKLLAEVRITDEQRAKGRTLIDRFAYLASHRVWTTHGMAGADGTFNGQTFRRNRGWVRFRKKDLSTGEYEERDYQLSDLEEMGDEALLLWSDIWDWITVDLNCGTPKKTEKFIRKVSVRLPRRLPSRK